MKRINPSTNNPYRCGDIDPDSGMVFRCYNTARMRKDGTYTEQWLMPEVFNAIKARMKMRARKRRDSQAFQRVTPTGL